MNKIVIWKKPDNTYYYRVYRHYFLRFEVGYYNSYGHEVIFIIDDLDDSFYRSKRFTKVRIKKKLINLINKI